jgi:hypothetical protein
MAVQHTVTLGREGLSIDGRPFFLLSGCLHYFRYPHAEWRDLLLQMRDFGLNTVDTVIPWNRHEPHRGEFDFSAEADLGAFLDLAAECGLYAIVRPDPYICAEWENGGIPAWLSGQEGVQLRIDDAIYREATLRWLDTLLAIIVPRQITHGGPVILCQIENEHWASGRYGHDFHQTTLAQAAIERGIAVPQYTCMGAMPGFAEFRNGWSGIAEKLQQTRALWPENPMIVSELWSGWFDNWGSSAHRHKTATQLDITLHRLTAVGASGFSHWMWAGGTNFGYWGGRTVGGDSIHMTTSYDYDAPIDEYGAPGAKAFVARRHHLFLGSLGAQLAPILADGVSGGPTVLAPAAVKGRSEAGGAPYRQVRAGNDAPAAWRAFSATYLQNLSFEGQTYQVFLKSPARHLAVEVEAGSIKPIFTGLPLRPGLTLAFHSSRLLGFWQEDALDRLVIYGFAGERGELGVREDSEERRAQSAEPRTQNPEPPAASALGAAELPATVSAVLDGDVLVLKYWITEQPTRVALQIGGRALEVLLLTQEQAERYGLEKSEVRSQKSEVVPSLNFSVHAVVEAETNEGWQAIDGPLALERLNCDYGYGWYRAEFTLDAPLTTTLCAPQLNDRGRVLLNGVDVGWLGVDPQGPQFALPLELSAGQHELRVLADNLGRFNYGSNLGELKGLLDTLYLGATQHDISGGWSALWQEAVFAGEAIANTHPAAVRADRSDVHIGNFAFSGPSVWLLRTFQAQAGWRYLLHTVGDRNPGALFINGVAVERFSRHRSGGMIHREISEFVRPGENVIALNITDYAGIAWRATLLEFDPAQALDARWSFRAGVTPEDVSSASDGPFFVRANFARLTSLKRLSLTMGALRKGQIWLNGRNIGRFWQAGPQEYYKLPLSWLEDENELLIFVEEGRPEGVRLV